MNGGPPGPPFDFLDAETTGFAKRIPKTRAAFSFLAAETAGFAK
jgi:hypothetical protein